MRIILASSSPRRKEIMRLITDNFTVISAAVDEKTPEDIPAEDQPQYLADIKAEAGAKICPDDVVIGCDTMVIFDGRVLGKPVDMKQCRQYIRMLSGKCHKVITGCAIKFGSIKRKFSVCTEVYFRELDDNEIEEYISSDEPYDKAGGYGIQGKGSLLTEKICGDYFNVVGLPVSKLNIELRKLLNDINKGDLL